MRVRRATRWAPVSVPFPREERERAIRPRAHAPSTSPHGVDDDRSVDTMPVPRVLTEEIRSAVLGAHGDEPVVAAQSPAAVGCEPFHAAADVAGEKRLCVVDAELQAVEHRQATNATGHERYDRVTSGVEHDVA